MAMFKRLFKWIAHKLCGNYTLYRIYRGPGPLPDGAEKAASDSSDLVFGPLHGRSELDASPHASLRELAQYAGEDAYGFGAWLDGSLVGACWYWVGERYRQRNYWPLKANEAKAIQIVTIRECRSRGIASKLTQYASAEMVRLGYHVQYARIWQSNQSSIGVLEKTGWTYYAFVIELYPLGRRTPLRITRRVRARRPERRS
jgi:hypothetical protein